MIPVYKNAEGDRICEVDDLSSAVKFVNERYSLDERAVVERVEKRVGQDAIVFSYQFFDKKTGLNVGHYSPITNLVSSFDHGRVYSNWEQKEIQEIDFWLKPAVATSVP